MSFDPQKPDFPNYEMPAEPKSSKKWWLIGGLGCVTILTLCCGGIGAIYVWIYQPAQQFVEEQITLAESSPRVAEILGDNPSVDRASPAVSSQTKDGKQIVVYEFPISGDIESGTLVFKGIMVSFSVWEVESTSLEVNGETHDLDPDAEFQLDIDDGGF